MLEVSEIVSLLAQLLSIPETKTLVRAENETYQLLVSRDIWWAYWPYTDAGNRIHRITAQRLCTVEIVPQFRCTVTPKSSPWEALDPTGLESRL